MNHLPFRPAVNASHGEIVIHKGHGKGMQNLDWFDGNLVSISWDGENGLKIAAFENYALYAISCFKNRIVVGGSNKLLCLLEKQNDEFIVKKFNLPDNHSMEKQNLTYYLSDNYIAFKSSMKIRNIAYLSDDYIAFESDGDIYLYDIRSENILDRLKRHSSGIGIMRLSHNRRYLGIIDHNDKVEIWSWDRKKKRLTLEQSYQENGQTYGTNITFSSDDRYMMTVSSSILLGINIFDIVGKKNMKGHGLQQCSKRGCIGCSNCIFEDVAFLNQGSGFVTIHQNKDLCFWKLPLERAEGPSLVQFIIQNEWKLYDKNEENILALLKSIFVLIAQSAFYPPFYWRWIE